MSIEERVDALITALNANTAILERVVAGQEKAIEKLEGKAPANKTTRGRPKKDETPEPEEKKPEPKAEEPAATESGDTDVADVTSEAKKIGTDVEKMKAYIADWTAEADDADERAARVDMLKKMAAHFGGKGYGALVTDKDTALKTVFFVERAKAVGLKNVDLDAKYDFKGAPDQEVDGGSDDGDEFE